MVIGVPRETKTHEFRVGMNPTSVREAVHHGHQVVVEHHAGHTIGLDDDDYRQVGAQIAADAAEVFARAELIVKVKEPQPAECPTLPFALALADRGYRQAMRDDPHLKAGLNIHAGRVTCGPVAESLGLPYHPADRMLAA